MSVYPQRVDMREEGETARLNTGSSVLRVRGWGDWKDRGIESEGGGGDGFDETEREHGSLRNQKSADKFPSIRFIKEVHTQTTHA